MGFIPELSAFNEQDHGREGNLGPRGQQFREWFQKHRILSCDHHQFACVDYELRPLRMFGPNFGWHLPEDMPQDPRKMSVDLLCRFQRNPVWCELKMNGDHFASAALQQILFYGSMLCGENQIRRCSRLFKDDFDTFHPWLGILAEERKDNRFENDFQITVDFCRHPDTANLLRGFFGGMLIGKIYEEEIVWKFSRLEVLDWR